MTARVLNAAALAALVASSASIACDDEVHLSPVDDAGAPKVDPPSVPQPFGSLAWSRTLGSAAGLDVLTDVIIAEDEGVVVAGVTLSESIGGHLIGEAGKPKNVVIKVSAGAGELAWAVVETGIGGAMAADASGGVIVRGADSLIRIDSSGALDWRRAREPGHVSALAIGADGMLYSAGYALREPEDAELIVASYDDAGVPAWTRRYPAAGAVTITDLAVAPTGDLVVAGVMEGALALGPDELDALDAGPEVSRAGFVAQLSPSGDARWAELITGGDRATIAGMGLDSEGSIFVAGTLEGRAGSERRRESFLRRYGAGGELQWERLFPLDGRLRAAVVDGVGGVVVAGTADGGHVGGEPLPRGARFVARYGRDGAFIGEVARTEASGYAALAAARGAVTAVGHVDLAATRCEAEAPDCRRYGLIDAFRMPSIID